LDSPNSQGGTFRSSTGQQAWQQQAPPQQAPPPQQHRTSSLHKLASDDFAKML
jgi:hypothetical protein